MESPNPQQRNILNGSGGPRPQGNPQPAPKAQGAEQAFPKMQAAGRPQFTQVRPEPKKNFKETTLAVALFLVLLLAAALGVFGFTQYRANKKSQLELQKASAPLSASSAIVDAVGKLMVLPDNETPTVATVTDLEKLKGQAFFANAKVGDKVLIFTQAKKAILYDPSSNKIVEVAPLNLGNASSTPATTP